MPDYQKDAVARYLNHSGLPPPKRGYNKSCRAFPDIAAQAEDFPVLKKQGREPEDIGGTSAASPTAAGVISLINDLRLQHGMSTLGFLNPMFYENAQVFNDIVSGSSMSGDFGGSKGWPAKEGWDAATGLGTINYKKLAQVAMSLPPGRVPQSTQSLDTVADRHPWSSSLVTVARNPNRLRLPPKGGVDDHHQSTIFGLPLSDASRAPRFPVELPIVELPRGVLMIIALSIVMVIGYIFCRQLAFCRKFRAPFPHWNPEAKYCEPLLPGCIA